MFNIILKFELLLRMLFERTQQKLRNDHLVKRKLYRWRNDKNKIAILLFSDHTFFVA